MPAALGRHQQFSAALQSVELYLPASCCIVLPAMLVLADSLAQHTRSCAHVFATTGSCAIFLVTSFSCPRLHSLGTSESETAVRSMITLPADQQKLTPFHP